MAADAEGFPEQTFGLTEMRESNSSRFMQAVFLVGTITQKDGLVATNPRSRRDNAWMTSSRITTSRAARKEVCQVLDLRDLVRAEAREFFLRQPALG